MFAKIYDNGAVIDGLSVLVTATVCGSSANSEYALRYSDLANISRNNGATIPS